jgi:hypothetical protein
VFDILEGKRRKIREKALGSAQERKSLSGVNPVEKHDDTQESENRKEKHKKQAELSGKVSRKEEENENGCGQRKPLHMGMRKNRGSEENSSQKEVVYGLFFLVAEKIGESAEEQNEEEKEGGGDGECGEEKRRSDGGENQKTKKQGLCGK